LKVEVKSSIISGAAGNFTKRESAFKVFTSLFYYIQIICLSLAILTVFVIMVLKPNREANLFLSLFIMVSALSYLPFLLWSFELWLAGDILTIIFMPSNALHGVFIYFYTVILTGQKKIPGSKHIVHLSVYFALLVFYILSFIINDSPRIEGQLLTINTLYMVGIGMVNSLTYVVVSFIKMKRYSGDIRNYFSEVKNRDINWFVKILITPLIFLLVSNSGFWYAFFTHPSPIVTTVILLTLCVSMFVTLSYLINQPVIVTQNRKMYDLIQDSKAEELKKDTDKYAKLGIDLPLQKSSAKKIDEYMQRQKPFLDEKLTIKDLSEKVGIPYYHISVVINNIHGKNFYNFVNEYRIAEAVAALKAEKNREAHIIDIAFDCGFNSKSTFNTVFKQITGMTPSAYRKTIKEKAEYPSGYPASHN